MSQPVNKIPENELGVERDMAREHLLRIETAVEQTDRMFVELDGLADGDLPDAPTTRLREAQEHISEAQELLISHEEVTKTRLKAISARLEEVRSDE